MIELDDTERASLVRELTEHSRWLGDWQARASELGELVGEPVDTYRLDQATRPRPRLTRRCGC